MAKPARLALIGSESLIAREIRDVVAVSKFPAELKLFADEDAEPGKLTEQAGEPAVVWGVDPAGVADVDAVILAGSVPSTRKVLAISPGVRLIDVTHAVEDNPRARVRAPLLEPRAYRLPEDAIHVVAHPASIAIATVLNRLHARFPLRRSLIHVFEPASERGSAGLDELQRQTVGLLSFKTLPKAIFDAQLAFNLLARYGEEAPQALEQIELRIERDLATLLSFTPEMPPPMPSLRLVQAPVFHGYSFSVWVEFIENPGTEALEQALAAAGLDVRGVDLEPPNNVGIAGESEIAAGAVAIDRNAPQACWLWMVVDNFRLTAVNALAVARQLI